MNILTIGASPYLVTRNGKLNAQVIRRFKEQGHTVASLVWHFNEGCFMPELDESYAYEQNGMTYGELYPFVLQGDESFYIANDLVQSLNPHVIVSVGDYHETAFVSAIREMSTTRAKWVAILPISSGTVNENYTEQLRSIDHAIVPTQFCEKALRKVYGGPITVTHPGISAPFSPSEARYVRPFRTLCSAKNVHGSNFPAFIRAIGLGYGRLVGHIHTDFHNIGECDLGLLASRYGAKNYIRMSPAYFDAGDWVTEHQLNILYNECHAIVDCSTGSASAMNLLEGMATGLIPVGPDYGAVGEIVRGLPAEFQFFVPHEVFIGVREEEQCVISSEGLKETLLRVQNLYTDDPVAYKVASKASVAMTQRLLKEEFLRELTTTVDRVRDLSSGLVAKQ